MLRSKKYDDERFALRNGKYRLLENKIKYQLLH